MVLELYHVLGSPPCAAVRMIAKGVGVHLKLKETSLMNGDHLKPEYLAINPQHTVPTLVDDGFVLWESRAIMVYLMEKYGQNSPLYPSDPKARALINQRLYFDLGTLYQRLDAHYFTQIFEKVPANVENVKKLEEAVGYLNTFLTNQTYAAGNSFTIADISLVVTVSTLEMLGFDLTKYPNVVAWYRRCKSIAPGYDINESSIDEFKRLFGHLLNA